MTSFVPVSVVIPTKNEARNVAECLASVEFAAECFVFDSFSTDETVELARRAGAHVVQREFDVFSAHKNWAIENLPFASQWVLLLDADERITAELREEIARVVGASDACDGYYIARKNLFCGKWIRHGGMYPDLQLRLFRVGKARYEDRIVHEHMIVDGRVGYLRHPMIHHDYKGIERYFDRHNHYSSLEAVEVFRMLRRGAGGAIAGDLRARGPGRRRALKNFAYRHLPMRSVMVFLYMYLLRLGFLDGRIGFRYCLMRSIHEYQISLKLLELRDPDGPMYSKYRRYIEETGEGVRAPSPRAPSSLSPARFQTSAPPADR